MHGVVDPIEHHVFEKLSEAGCQGDRSKALVTKCLPGLGYEHLLALLGQCRIVPALVEVVE